MELSNPHNIVLNQTLNFSQSNFSTKVAEARKETDNNIKEHWIDTEAKLDQLVENLKMSELLIPPSDSRNIQLREKVSGIIESLNTMKRTAFTEVDKLIS